MMESSNQSPTLPVLNPSTGEELGQVVCSTPEQVAQATAKARLAWQSWQARPWSDRQQALKRLRRVLRDQSDAWISALIREVGKPRAEAAGEVLTTIDMLDWTIRNGGSTLKPRSISAGFQRLAGMKSGLQEWRSLGIVGIWGTWNYPLMLNLPAIAQAIAAGNAVLFKPSEQTPLLGVRIEQTLKAAELPTDLVQIIHGGMETGQALANQPINKGMYTGGTTGGRAVLTALARQGIPAIAELSGFDAAIILPDAPKDSTIRTLLWASFVACGQACVSMKRIYIVGDPQPWKDEFAQAAKQLRVGNPELETVDVGPMISRSARDRFHETIAKAIKQGAQCLQGGQPLNQPGWYYQPTVLTSEDQSPQLSQPEQILEGCFGPAVMIRGFKNIPDAIQAANASQFGLSATVWGTNRTQTAQVAAQLQAGAIGINEACIFASSASSPFGGLKASGHGRVHGAFGLREFAQPVTIHQRSPKGFRPQLFPYGPKMESFIDFYRRWIQR